MEHSHIWDLEEGEITLDGSLIDESLNAVTSDAQPQAQVAAGHAPSGHAPSSHSHQESGKETPGAASSSTSTPPSSSTSASHSFQSTNPCTSSTASATTSASATASASGTGGGASPHPHHHHHQQGTPRRGGLREEDIMLMQLLEMTRAGESVLGFLPKPPYRSRGDLSCFLSRCPSV